MTSCNDTGAIAHSTATPIGATEAQSYHGWAGVEFVDPRPADEVTATTGKIPGARIISIDDIEAGTLPPAFADRSLRVVTTCQAGPRAERAASGFARLGFARVNWIEGGTQAWIDAGFPTVR